MGSEEYLINASLPQGSILGTTPVPLYINHLPDDICDFAICADDKSLYSKCDHASSLRQQLKLASEIESDLRDTAVWDRKRLVDFKAGKTQLVSFDQSNNLGATDVKMDGFDLCFLKRLGLSFSSKLYCIVNFLPGKLEP